MPARPEVTSRRIGIGHNNPPEPIDPLELMTKRELAEVLGVNPWTIDRWRDKRPDFPKPLWISASTLRWRRQEIERWLATRQRGGTSPAYREMRKQKRRRELFKQRSMT